MADDRFTKYLNDFSADRVAMLEENLGVEITLEPMESSSFSRLMNANQHQFALMGWGADYPDPDNWLPEGITMGPDLHTGYPGALLAP